MPALETHLKDRPHKAVLWPFSGFLREDGQPSVGDPEEISVRWNTRRRQATDPKGNTIILDATVITNQTVVLGSHIWRGELSDLAGAGAGIDPLDILSPHPPFDFSSGTSEVRSEVMRVTTISVTSDIKGRNTRYELGLSKLHEVTA